MDLVITVFSLVICAIVSLESTVTENYDSSCYSMVECQSRIHALHDKLTELQSKLEGQTGAIEQQNGALENIQSQLDQHNNKLTELQSQQNGTLGNIQSQLGQLNNLLQPLLSVFKIQENFKYVFLNDKKTWTNARKHCQDLGGDLVAIETTGEWQYLVGRVRTYLYKDECGVNQNGSPNYGGYWTSGNKKDNQWVWGDSDVTVLNKWPISVREPSGDGNCMEMSARTNYYFNDIPCSDSVCYICEL